MQTAPEAAELAGFQGKREEEKKKNRSVLDLFHRPFLKKEKGKKKERVGADIRHRSEPKLLLFFAENRFKEVVSDQQHTSHAKTKGAAPWEFTHKGTAPFVFMRR